MKSQVEAPSEREEPLASNVADSPQRKREPCKFATWVARITRWLSFTSALFCALIAFLNLMNYCGRFCAGSTAPSEANINLRMMWSGSYQCVGDVLFWNSVRDGSSVMSTAFPLDHPNAGQDAENILYPDATDAAAITSRDAWVNAGAGSMMACASPANTCPFMCKKQDQLINASELVPPLREEDVDGPLEQHRVATWSGINVVVKEIRDGRTTAVVDEQIECPTYIDLGLRDAWEADGFGYAKGGKYIGLPDESASEKAERLLRPYEEPTEGSPASADGGLGWTGIHPKARTFWSDGMNGPPRPPGVEIGHVAQNWRSVFSLTPEIFIDLWTPFVFAWISIGCHHKDYRIDGLGENWVRICIFHVIKALWGEFGYVGNLGIVGGFLSLAVAVLSLLSMYVAPDTEIFGRLNDTSNRKEARLVQEDDGASCERFSKEQMAEVKRLGTGNPEDLESYAKTHLIGKEIQVFVPNDPGKHDTESRKILAVKVVELVHPDKEPEPVVKLVVGFDKTCNLHDYLSRTIEPEDGAEEHGVAEEYVGRRQSANSWQDA